MESVHDNPAFQLWNISKRISAVKHLRDETADLLSQAQGSLNCPGPEADELRAIAERASLLAARADDLWAELEAVAGTFDPGLVDETAGSPGIIRNRGPNAAAVAAIERAWARETCVADAGLLADRFDQLLVRLRREPRT